jgi:hypothetical protein
MLIERSCILPCSPKRCFAEVESPRLLSYVSRPLVRFVAIDPPAFPKRWEEREYRVGLRILGWIPLGSQVIGIARGDFSDDENGFRAQLRDNGHSALVSKWDHWITVESAPGGCRYTDRIELQAGALTPLVGAFAWVFYRHRQRRWQRLVRQDFAYR